MIALFVCIMLAMNEKRPIQYGLGGGFGGPQPEIKPEEPPKKKEEKVPEHPNAPEGSTHLVAKGKDIFFFREPTAVFGGGAYENAYKVSQAFYAEHLKTEDGWGYFRVKGISKQQGVPFVTVWRGGEYNLGEDYEFRTRMRNTKKIED